MTPLSSAAQAVLDAATAPTGDFCLENVNEIAAAALRAAADQVVPVDNPLSLPTGAPQSFAIQRRTTRCQILAIAAELAGGTTTPTEL